MRHVGAVLRTGVAAWPAAALVVAAAPAWAHEDHRGPAVVVQRVVPALDGVRVRAVPGGPGKLAIRTTGSTTAQVLTSSGQPIFRVGPRGVEANAAAPAWYQVNEPLGIARVPADAGEREAPRWRRVSRARTWEWFDHRLHPGGPEVVRWVIPIAAGGRRALVRGRLDRGPGVLGLRLDDAQPVAGAEVTVVEQPVLALRVRATGSAPVTIRGPEGELFARVGPRTTKANARSAAWPATAQYRNRDLLETVVDPDAEPRMVRADPGPELIWPDPRLVPRRPLRPAGGEVPVQRWAIPVVVGGRRTAVSGTTVLRPRKANAEEPGAPPGAVQQPAAPATGGGGGSGIAIAAGAVALAALAALGSLLRRRRR